MRDLLWQIYEVQAWHVLAACIASFAVGFVFGLQEGGRPKDSQKGPRRRR